MTESVGSGNIGRDEKFKEVKLGREGEVAKGRRGGISSSVLGIVVEE